MAVAPEFASRFQGGTETEIWPKSRQSERSGEDLRIRRRCEKSVRVQFVKRLARIPVDHQNSPKNFLGMLFLENRPHPGSESRDIFAIFRRRISWDRIFSRRIRWHGMSLCASRESAKERQEKQSASKMRSSVR